MSNVVQLDDYRPAPSVPDDLVWELMTWNKLLPDADVVLAVPYDGWREGFFDNQTPFQTEIMKRITELVRPWLDAQTETTAIYFHGSEGVMVTIGDYDFVYDCEDK